jgi:hypothetical protein
MIIERVCMKFLYADQRSIHRCSYCSKDKLPSSSQTVLSIFSILPAYWDFFARVSTLRPTYALDFALLQDKFRWSGFEMYFCGPRIFHWRTIVSFL